MLLPTNAGRRSKEEREARNAADLQRERERNKERDALAVKKQKAIEAAERREKMRNEGRGRGGHSGVSSFFGGHRPGRYFAEYCYFTTFLTMSRQKSSQRERLWRRWVWIKGNTRQE